MQNFPRISTPSQFFHAGVPRPDEVPPTKLLAVWQSVCVWPGNGYKKFMGGRVEEEEAEADGSIPQIPKAARKWSK